MSIYVSLLFSPIARSQGLMCTHLKLFNWVCCRVPSPRGLSLVARGGIPRGMGIKELIRGSLVGLLDGN